MTERLALEGPKTLKAFTVNGTVIVESEADRQRKKAERAQKRKSRWDDGSAKKNEKHSVQGMQTIINIANTSDKQQQIYLLQLQIREATQKLAEPNLGIPPNPRDRSPSPEPIYNSKGVRMNTRYERTKAKLTAMRNNAITKLKTLDPSYQPPSNYAYKNTQLEDKIDVPQDEYPQYNFMGLLLGPRGNSLEKIKQKYSCKIIVKGRGSVKDGMTGLKKDGTKYDALEESMFVHITGHSAESVRACGDHIRDLIKEQIENPDGERMVALRAAHMHELAVLNGTVRDIDMKCLNCGREGHKSWQCPESENVTASIICTRCGGVGHVTKDCKQRRPGEIWNQSAGGAELDDEYAAFLDDLGIAKKKKAKTDDDKPYVPPMGDLSKIKSTGSTSSTPTPRLMLTNGTSAPGAAIAAAKKQSASGNNAFSHLEQSRTAMFASRFKLGQAPEKEEKKQKPQENYVPTHWIAEQQDREQAKQYEQELARLEHAKLLAKIQKRKDESRVIKVDGPPPAPPGSSKM
eukprot:TRINITY_DN2278_c0_g1_i9.p1 TRINITY_DN2278_c0_g1~~TRINITY_DN2278_c0_g1_i9.p1  ORF type:complete len:518 (-),score=143.18 TRINITY_DN2278_c0_g1_i9:610-2163(-)